MNYYGFKALLLVIKEGCVESTVSDARSIISAKNITGLTRSPFNIKKGALDEDEKIGSLLDQIIGDERKRYSAEGYMNLRIPVVALPSLATGNDAKIMRRYLHKNEFNKNYLFLHSCEAITYALGLTDALVIESGSYTYISPIIDNILKTENTRSCIGIEGLKKVQAKQGIDIIEALEVDYFKDGAGVIETIKEVIECVDRTNRRGLIENVIFRGQLTEVNGFDKIAENEVEALLKQYGQGLKPRIENQPFLELDGLQVHLQNKARAG